MHGGVAHDAGLGDLVARRPGLLGQRPGQAVQRLTHHTFAHESTRQTVALLKSELARRALKVPILIGGGLMDEHVFRYVGADYRAADAMDGVRLCRQLIARP